MTRDLAFSMACFAARSGVPVHPRTHALMKKALEPLTAEEEALLRSYREVREGTDEQNARDMSRFRI